MQGAHVTLLREPQTNFAKVFLFGGSGIGQEMRVWRFNPLANTAWVPSTTSSDSGNLLYRVAHPNNRLVDLFCGGHSTLSDGRLLYLGGEWAPSHPCQMSWAFDPRWYPDTTSHPAWSQLATMAVDRWYPSVTALADGKHLASSGTSRTYMLVFGGDKSDGTENATLHPLAIAGRYHWSDTTTAPDASGVTNGKWPAGREDHAMVGDLSGRVFVMGGRKGTQAGGWSYLDDVWQRSDSSVTPPVRDDSTSRWSKCAVVADPAAGIPAPRARFAATWAGLGESGSGNRTQLHAHPPSYSGDSLVVYIHGGIGASGLPLGDLWRGWRRTNPGGYYEWVWQKLRDDPATARYGHTMVYDPGPVTGLAYPDHARLLIFGGRTGTSTLASNAVLACRVGSWGKIVEGWYQPAMTVGPYGTPVAREGHVGVMDPSRLGGRRMYVFGGVDAAGAPVDTAVWYLSRADAALSDTVYTWARTPRVGGPSPRTRATAGFLGPRLTLFGGDTNGAAAGGLVNEVWDLLLHPGVPQYGTWTQPYLRDFAPPDAPAMAGMASWTAPEGVSSRHLEAFSTSGTSDPGAACTDPLNGQWTTLTTQDPLSAQAMALYPQLQVLPDGRLFHAGPSPAENAAHPYKRFFNLTSKRWEDSTAQAHYDAIAFGASVHYRPGKLLRAGAHGESEVLNGNKRTETIEIAAGALPGWQEYVANPPAGRYEMIARTNHNLTVLPTGDVLVSGGRRVGADSSSATRTPQLWDASLAAWTTTTCNPLFPLDTLASDPKPRNYHSAAVLLPDARVLTSGGEGKTNFDKFTASIYEPPYLFRGTVEDYAPRPAWQDGPETLPYNRTLTFQLTDSNLVSSITSVALNRPGSATHGFDMNQRYVPLGFAWADNPKRLLVQTPLSGNHAPPGEYMLFAIGNMAADATRVPSIAKWVQLPTTSPTLRDSLDAVAPRGGSYLALSDQSTCPNYSADLTLGWIAPADDDVIAGSGPAAGYNLRYKLNSNPEPNFNAWTAIATGAPGLVGTSEQVVLSGLSPAVWYRFQLKAVGDNVDTSLISNALVARPQYCEGEGGGGSGGGGGGFALRGAQPSSAQSSGETGYENSLFPGPLSSQPGRDALKFASPPRLTGGRRWAYIRQGSARGLSLDRARLIAVDHSAGMESAMAPDGRFLTGVRVPALAVSDRTERDLSAAAAGTTAEPVYADSGEVLRVTLRSPGESAERYLLVEASAGDHRGGIVVEGAPSGGQASELGTIHPRRRWSTAILPLAGSTEVSLRFHGAYAVRFVGALAQVSEAATSQANLLSAGGAGGSDHLAQASALDGSDAVLAPGDTLTLSFADLAPGAEARDWYLVLDGQPLTPEAAASRAGEARGERRDQPLAFRLHQNVPNPFHHTTLIAFDLPAAGFASLEIFDTQGRLVRRYAEHRQAGRHHVEWNLRDRSGRAVRPGIYTYRLAAAGKAAVRKLVVLP